MSKQIQSFEYYQQKMLKVGLELNHGIYDEIKKMYETKGGNLDDSLNLDCKDCTQCYACIKCVNCENIYESAYSHGCKNGRMFYKSVSCNDSINCIGSMNCSNCKMVVRCVNCTNCESSEDLKDCSKCKHCKCCTKCVKCINEKHLKNVSNENLEDFDYMAYVINKLNPNFNPKKIYMSFPTK